MPEYCLAERNGHILTVTLNRPERMNALHSLAHFELDEIFNDFENDPDLWVAIVTGAGDKAFSAGNDLKWQAEGNPTSRPDSGFAGLASRYTMQKPLIAAVNGLAMGGGFETVLNCDIVIADETARKAETAGADEDNFRHGSFFLSFGPKRPLASEPHPCGNACERRLCWRSKR